MLVKNYWTNLSSRIMSGENNNVVMTDGIRQMSTVAPREIINNSC